MFKFLPVLLLVLMACNGETVETSNSAGSYNIDASRISISGVSSGAYMAGQVHLAHSSVFNGAAIIAGGPYYCAMGALTRVLGPCMKGGDLGLSGLTEYAQSAAKAGKLDELANLEDDHVWVFHGALDTVVHQDASVAAVAFYNEFVAADAVTLVTDIAVVHGLATLASGPPCDTFGAPFLNACDYDTAGEVLTSLHGELNSRAAAVGPLQTIEQPGFDSAEMLEQAFLYVPAACAAGRPAVFTSHCTVVCNRRRTLVTPLRRVPVLTNGQTPTLCWYCIRRSRAARLRR